jgi:hypothetical protein
MGWVQRLAVGLGVALACAPIRHREPSTLPFNTCPDHPCEAYGSPSPPATCTAGACVVPMKVPDDLVLTVAIPEGAASVSGADRTFAVRFADLLKTSKNQSACAMTGCVHLPPPASLSGYYTVDTQTAARATAGRVDLRGPSSARRLPHHRAAARPNLSRSDTRNGPRSGDRRWFRHGRRVRQWSRGPRGRSTSHVERGTQRDWDRYNR